MKQWEGKEMGGEGARELGVHSFISMRCQQNQREAKLPRLSEKRVSIAVEMQEVWFLFLFILYYKIASLHFDLLVIDKEAATQVTHRKKEEAQSSFYQDFRPHLGRGTSIVFVIAVIIIIGGQRSLLEEFSTTYCSSEFIKIKLFVKEFGQSKPYTKPV